MTKPYADTCLERADKATEGPWSTLEEENEVHAIKFVDNGGDPLHIAQWINEPENAEFIAYARTDVPELAKRLKRALEALRRPNDYGNYMREKLIEELEAIPGDK